jgi:hypothetical protein
MCLKALAQQLGLHYDKICAAMTGCEIANNGFVYDSGDDNDGSYCQPPRQDTKNRKKKPHKPPARPTTRTKPEARHSMAALKARGMGRMKA